MIEKYFLQIESLIQEFVDIDSYSIKEPLKNKLTQLKAQ